MMKYDTRVRIAATVAVAAVMALGAEAAAASAAPVVAQSTAMIASDEPQAIGTDVEAVPIAGLDTSAELTAVTQPQTAISNNDAVPVQAATPVDAQADINNALNQAGSEFMLAATIGSMAGGVVGLVGGCVVGAVVGAIGGCIPGLGIGAAIGPIIGGVVVGVPAGIAALIQAYNTLNAAGEISAPSAAMP
ncbi:hypothetical protein [Nocardia sp. NPDC004123]